VSESAKQPKPPETTRIGFWKRQFGGEPTRAQTRFDVIAGMILPIFCLAADPIVFFGYDSILARYRWLAYTFIGVEIMILSLWLLLGRRATGSAAFFVGPLFAGSLFALTVGLGILPATIPGIFVIIGLLGLTPFFTALVFARNGVRALVQSRVHYGRFARVMVLLAGLLFIGTPSLFVLHAYHHNTLPGFMQEAGSGLNTDSRLGNWIRQGGHHTRW